MNRIPSRKGGGNHIYIFFYANCNKKSISHTILCLLTNGVRRVKKELYSIVSACPLPCPISIVLEGPLNSRL